MRAGYATYALSLHHIEETMAGPGVGVDQFRLLSADEVQSERGGGPHGPDSRGSDGLRASQGGESADLSDSGDFFFRDTVPSLSSTARSISCSPPVPNFLRIASSRSRLLMSAFFIACEGVVQRRFKREILNEG